MGRAATPARSRQSRPANPRHDGREPIEALGRADRSPHDQSMRRRSARRPHRRRPCSRAPARGDVLPVVTPSASTSESTALVETLSTSPSITTASSARSMRWRRRDARKEAAPAQRRDAQLDVTGLRRQQTRPGPGAIRHPGVGVRHGRRRSARPRRPRSTLQHHRHHVADQVDAVTRHGTRPAARTVGGYVAGWPHRVADPDQLPGGSATQSRRSFVVRPPGFEPGTNGLRVHCSAVELEALVRPGSVRAAWRRTPPVRMG